MASTSFNTRCQLTDHNISSMSLNTEAIHLLGKHIAEYGQHNPGIPMRGISSSWLEDHNVARMRVKEKTTPIIVCPSPQRRA